MKSSKFFILLGAALLLAGAAYFIAQAPGRMRVETLAVESKTGERHLFLVEIADTPAKEKRGLMFRRHLAPDHGMLFEMGRTDIASFWMKNTLIPLDMLFIAADGEIKTIHANAVPLSLQSISSGVPVRAVLEINGGLAQALGIKSGDRVVHPYAAGPKF